MPNAIRTTPRVIYTSAVILSALTMLWLFWRYPTHALLLTLAALGCMSLCTRLAGSLEPDLDDPDTRASEGPHTR